MVLSFPRSTGTATASPDAPMDLPQCRVTPGGVAHLFMTLDVGHRCVCGRKVAVVDRHGVLDIRDGAFVLPHGESFREQFRGLLR